MRNGMYLAFGSLTLSLCSALQGVGQNNVPARQPAEARRAPRRQAEAAQRAGPAAGRSRPTNQQEVVAIVNGEGIARGEFEQQLESAMKMQQQSGGGKPPRVGQVQQQVLNNLIEARLVEQYMRQHGPSVDSGEVDQALEGLRSQLPDGITLEKYFASQQQSLADFRKRIEASLAWRKFQQKQLSREKLQAFYESERENFEGASFDEIQPRITQLYVSKIWADIVGQMKPQAKIQVVEAPAPAAKASLRAAPGTTAESQTRQPNATGRQAPPNQGPGREKR